MRANTEDGYTLIEMLIVVGLLALIAAVAAPAFTGDDEAVLEHAASEVARAMRFAHSEAIRTDQPYGVIASTSGQSLKVYRLDESVTPPVPVYEVYDPQAKQLYDLRFDTGSLEASIDQVYFKFSGFLFPQTYIGFAAGTGVPKFNDSGTIRMLENGFIKLSHDGMTRTIAVSPMTARVTVQ